MPYIIAAAIIILIISVALYLIKPNKPRKETGFFTQYKYAHRGLHDYKQGIPENSLIAFEHAKNAGFGVELDVQLTSDKKAVVFHDETLKRMCGSELKVWMLTYEELSTYTLQNTSYRIPLLTEALDVLGNTPIVLEIKTYGNLSDLSVCGVASEILSKYKNSRICVESFNPLAIRFFRKNCPHIVRGQLSMDYSEADACISKFLGFFLRNLCLNFISRPDFIAYRYTDKCFGLKICKKLFGAAIVAWTVKDQASESRLNIFDTIIFEGYIPDEIKNQKKPGH